MQIDSSINSLLKLEKELEQSTQKLAKLNKNSDGSTTKGETSSKKHSNSQEEQHFDDSKKEHQYKQPETPMPLAYGVDNNKISVFTSAHQTLLDIKA